MPLRPIALRFFTFASLLLLLSASASPTHAVLVDSGASGGIVHYDEYPDDTYYVRVKAEDASGNQSIYSDIYTVGLNYPPIAAACSVNPVTTTSLPGFVNETSFTWSIVLDSVSGGDGTYTYSWSGTDVLSGDDISVAKTYADAGTKSASITITSAGRSSTFNCLNTALVNERPDLIAGGVTLNSTSPVVTGDTRTLSATVTNDSPGPTINSFTSVFQIKGTDTTSVSNIAVRQVTNNALAGGANSGALTATYQFPSAGIYNIRLCADKIGAVTYMDDGFLIERDEDNNCSANWTTVTVYDPLAATCSVNPTGGFVNETNFTWKVSGVTGGDGTYTYSWSGGPGANDGLSGNTGDTSNTINSTTKTYSSAGSKTGTVEITSAGLSLSKTCAVTVVARPDLTALNTMASPASSIVGQETDFSAAVSNIGAGTATTSFPNSFQIAKDTEDNPITRISAGAISTLAAGASGALPTNLSLGSYTAPASAIAQFGTSYFVRACANINTSGDLQTKTNESNINNNCDDWKPFTVYRAINGTCSVSSSGPPLGSSGNYTSRAYTWRVSNVVGGNGTYTYSWSGDGGLSKTTADTTATTNQTDPISYTSPGDKNTSITISSAGLSETVNCSTLTVLPISDLTAAATARSAASGMVGKPITFSSSVLNIRPKGTGATPSAFPNMFQIGVVVGVPDEDPLRPADDPNDFTYDTVNASAGPSGLGLSTPPSTSPSESISASNYEFSDPSTRYRVRACANFNRTWSGSIVEADIGNNCGTWSSEFIVYPAIGGTCSVAPANGFVGETAFNWTLGSVTGGDLTYTYEWSGGPGSGDELSKTTINTSAITDSVGKTYTAAGTKTAKVKITSAGYSTELTCTNSANVLPPLSIVVDPSSYSITLPSNSVPVVYKLTNGNSVNTKCRLLDNAGAALTSYASCSTADALGNRRMTVNAPTTPDTYAYSIEAYKSSTNETRMSNSFTITVNPPGAISASCSASPASGTVSSTSFEWKVDSVSGGGIPGSYAYVWSGGPGADDGLSGSQMSVNKTYTTTGGKSGKVRISSGGAEQLFDCGTVNVCASGTRWDGSACAPLPDLTATLNASAAAVAAALLAVGPSLDFTARISSANAPTPPGVNFANLYQIATSYNPATDVAEGVQDIQTFSLSALSAGSVVSNPFEFTLPTDISIDVSVPGVASAVLAYTPSVPSSSGDFFLRVCADKSSSGDAVGSVEESNENNNCSGWQSIDALLPTYSCTGLPANATGYPSPDDTDLTADTSYVFSSTDTSAKCEFTCATGTAWNGTACSTNTYTITPSAGAGGTISPATPTSVAHGGSQAFAFSANTGYRVSSVVIDGTAVTPTPSSPYTFSNVTANHSIAVSFVQMTGTLSTPASCTISAGQGTCSVNVTWNTTNPINTSAVTRDNPANTTVFTGNSGTNQATSLSGANGSYNFYLYNTGVQLASRLVTVSCATGTAWNGLVCATITFSCTGLPANATGYPAPDNTGLTVNTPYTHSTTDTAAKCEFACASGFAWNGASCAANQPPTAPAISGPTTGQPNTSYTFTFSSTDPEGNQLNYQIDWDNNGAANQTLPATGFVSSGVSQSAGNDWGSIGTKIFKARAVDSVGTASTWASHTITLAMAAPTGTLIVPPSCVIAIGASSCSVSATWTTSNVTSPSLVNGATEVVLSTAAQQGAPGLPLTVGYPSLLLNLKDGALILNTKTVFASCASGGAWDGSRCMNLLPDLTATLAAPLSAVRGTPVNFSARISNINAPTATGFTNLFQKATSASGAGAQDVTTFASDALQAGVSATDFINYTFPLLTTSKLRTLGAVLLAQGSETSYMRACADKSSSGDAAGQIEESNENNNCSDWQPVSASTGCVANQGASCAPTNACDMAADPAGTIQCDGSCSVSAPSDAACPALSVSCSGSPGNPYIGQTVTWSSSVSSGAGNYNYSWSGDDGLSGTSASVTKSYSSAGIKRATVEVTNAASGQTGSASCTTGPLQANGPPAIDTGGLGVGVGSCLASLSANPSTVEQGNNTSLSWSVTGGSICASSCTGSGFSTGGAISGTGVPADIYPAPPSTAYSLTCTAGTYGPPPPVNTVVSVIVPPPTLTIVSQPAEGGGGGGSGGGTVTAGGESIVVDPSVPNNVVVSWAPPPGSYASCAVTKNGVAWNNNLSSSGTVDTVTTQTTYTVECVRTSGVRTRTSVLVNVLLKYREF